MQIFQSSQRFMEALRNGYTTATFLADYPQKCIQNVDFLFNSGLANSQFCITADPFLKWIPFISVFDITKHTRDGRNKQVK